MIFDTYVNVYQMVSSPKKNSAPQHLPPVSTQAWPGWPPMDLRGALVEKHESLEMAFSALDSAAEGALTMESLAAGIEAVEPKRGECGERGEVA